MGKEIITKLPGEGGSHYKNNKKIETFLLMENVLANVQKVTNDLNAALWASQAMKHLDRLGTKDSTDIHEEMLKVENYMHRARTGEWMPKDDAD